MRFLWIFWLQEMKSLHLFWLDGISLVKIGLEKLRFVSVEMCEIDKNNHFVVVSVMILIIYVFLTMIVKNQMTPPPRGLILLLSIYAHIKFRKKKKTYCPLKIKGRITGRIRSGLFLGIFTVAFLLILAPAGGINQPCVGQSLTLT